MKLGLPILLALLPVVLAAPSPSRTAPRDVPADSDEAVSGIIDLSELADLPAPTPVPVDVAYSSVNLASVATSLSAVQSVTAASSVPTAIPVRKRQASCQPFSSFSSPNNGVPTDVSGFQSHFASTPANLVGYGAPIYTGVNSVGPKNGLMGVYAYTQYDPSTCKAKCDSMANCQSFATWIERVPTQKYDATNCPSPSNDPTYQTKCLYYSFPLAASDATNTGQWTNNGQFQVAQASVNFYNKASSNFSPAPVPGYNGPTGGYGVCAPAGTKADMDGPINTASGPVMADSLARTPGPMSSPIDPSFCANTCKTIRDSQATDSHGIKLNCNMFSLFELYGNGKYYYQCQYWTKDLDASRNTNCGGGAVVASWKYTLSDPVPSYVNTKPAQQNY